MFQTTTFSFNPDFFRHGFQGSEEDDEVKGDGNSYTTEFRQLDPRLGRWLSLDPKMTAFESPYASMGNNPIKYNDQKGDSIYLSGSYADQLIAVAYLQMLTNDKLVLKGKYVVIEKMGGYNQNKKLPVGTELVRELIHHDKLIYIHQNESRTNNCDRIAGEDVEDESNGVGVTAIVNVDLMHQEKVLTENSVTHDSEFTDSPAQITLAHELGHGLSKMNGEQPKEGTTATYTYKDEKGKQRTFSVDKEELENTGLTGNRKITENKIRKEQGFRKRVKY